MHKQLYVRLVGCNNKHREYVQDYTNPAHVKYAPCSVCGEHVYGLSVLKPIELVILQEVEKLREEVKTLNNKIGENVLNGKT